jgi:Bacterial protein of unknown function (DUF899)
MSPGRTSCGAELSHSDSVGTFFSGRHLPSSAKRLLPEPMVKIDTAYAFDGPNGKASFIDLFEGRRQLIVW